MQMHGSRQLAVTAQQAWAALNDPEILKQCIPGCQSFEPDPTDENAYKVVAQIKIGPVSAKFTGRVKLTDIDPPHGYTLHFEAQGGVAGHGKGTSEVSLEPNANGVELNYTVQSQIGGKLAQLGQRLIDGAAKSMADDFFKRFEKALPATEGDQLDLQAPASSDKALDSPRPGSGAIPRWLWIAIAAAVAVVILATQT